MKPSNAIKSSALYAWTFLAIFISGCSSSEQNSLLTDQIGGTSSVTDTTAKATDVYLKLSKNSTIYADQTTGRIEIQGDCFVSGYADNYITLSFKMAGSAMAIPPRWLKMTTLNSNLACVSGKFYFIIDTKVLSDNATLMADAGYSVTGQLSVKDPVTGSYIQPTSGKFTQAFTKATVVVTTTTTVP